MTTPGTPCQQMWDRLVKVYGEVRVADAVATIFNRNSLSRKIPLVETSGCDDGRSRSDA